MKNRAHLKVLHQSSDYLAHIAPAGLVFLAERELKAFYNSAKDLDLARPGKSRVRCRLVHDDDVQENREADRDIILREKIPYLRSSLPVSRALERLPLRECWARSVCPARP